MVHYTFCVHVYSLIKKAYVTTFYNYNSVISYTITSTSLDCADCS